MASPIAIIFSIALVDLPFLLFLEVSYLEVSFLNSSLAASTSTFAAASAATASASYADAVDGASFGAIITF
tara:strand:- start:436 stop:648 length:213 start_codon:yes stop_codon:yes gene_type:complete